MSPTNTNYADNDNDPNNIIGNNNKSASPYNEQFRVLMKVRDADGMTFLMHAANPASSGSKKKKGNRPKPIRFQQIGGGGGGHAGPFVSRATTTGHLGVHTTTWGAGSRWVLRR